MILDYFYFLLHFSCIFADIPHSMDVCGGDVAFVIICFCYSWMTRDPRLLGRQGEVKIITITGSGDRFYLKLDTK